MATIRLTSRLTHRMILHCHVPRLLVEAQFGLRGASDWLMLARHQSEGSDWVASDWPEWEGSKDREDHHKDPNGHPSFLGPGCPPRKDFSFDRTVALAAPVAASAGLFTIFTHFIPGLAFSAFLSGVGFRGREGVFLHNTWTHGSLWWSFLNLVSAACLTSLKSGACVPGSSCATGCEAPSLPCTGPRHMNAKAKRARNCLMVFHKSRKPQPGKQMLEPK